MDGPFRDTNSLDLLRGQKEILQRENALLKRENKSLSGQNLAMQVKGKPPASIVVTEIAKTVGLPILQVSLVAGAVVTGNMWFAVILLFTL